MVSGRSGFLLANSSPLLTKTACPRQDNQPMVGNGLLLFGGSNYETLSEVRR